MRQVMADAEDDILTPTELENVGFRIVYDAGLRTKDLTMFAADNHVDLNTERFKDCKISLWALHKSLTRDRRMRSVCASLFRFIAHFIVFLVVVYQQLGSFRYR